MEEVYPQAVLRAGYESRLRTARVGSIPFTLTRFLRGQKWPLGHHGRIQAALTADARLVHLRGNGHPGWRRVEGAQTELAVVTVVKLTGHDEEPAAQ